MTQIPFDSFSSLNLHSERFAHAFLVREPDLPMQCDREEALHRLHPLHLNHVETAMGFARDHWWRAEQVHGAEVAVVGGSGSTTVLGVDGLISNQPNTLLGIYVADCGPVFLLDPVRGAIGLLHSGKLGSAADITGVGIRKMETAFGSRPEDILVQLGPCIRPPAYEVDCPAQIRASALAAGVPAAQFQDCGTCTSSDLSRYYSYRVEKGKTGRMLALLGVMPIGF